MKDSATPADESEATSRATRPAARVASFELDHTRVRAPYVRLADRYEGPRGDVITKFDLRLVQPNAAEIPTAPLHSLEHLLAGWLRELLTTPGPQAAYQVIDVSPMGCRTGFYLSVLGEPPAEVVRDALEQALRRAAAHRGPIPAATAERCGNYRDHAPEGAAAWAAAVLERPIIVEQTVLLAGTP